MTKYTYCNKIFDPTFAYNCAARTVGDHHELKSMLEAIGYEDLIMNTEEFEKVYPIKTLYHRFRRNILVLTHTGDSFMGQIFCGGMVGDGFDIYAENSKLKSFFKNAGEDVTVLDFFTGKELKPTFDTVMAYTERVMAANRELDEHRSIMDEFRKRNNELRQNCETLYCTSPSTSYKKAINLLRECMETAEGTFRMKHRQTVRELELFLAFAPGEEAYIKMFGLYVYALKYATEHRRFLKRGAKILSLTFNQMLSDMRKFIAENEGIVDKYIGYMELTRNERENLIYLLSEEQLMTYGSKTIGDDLFC